MFLALIYETMLNLFKKSNWIPMVRFRGKSYSKKKEK